MTFNQLNVSAPGVLSAVRAADGMVYFSVYPNSGPLDITLVAFPNNAIGNNAGISNYPGSNLAADTAGNVYLLNSRSQLHAFRHSVGRVYPTNLPASGPFTRWSMLAFDTGSASVRSYSGRIAT